MWKWVGPLEEAMQCIRCSIVYRDDEFLHPSPTSAIISQVMLSPWWLSSSGHMSQAEALVTRAWRGSGRNWATEYLWGRKQRTVWRVKPKQVSRTAGSTSNAKGLNHRRGTVEQVGVGGGREAVVDRVGSVSSSAITTSDKSLILPPLISSAVKGRNWQNDLRNSSYSHSLCPPMPAWEEEP